VLGIHVLFMTQGKNAVFGIETGYVKQRERKDTWKGGGTYILKGGKKGDIPYVSWEQGHACAKGGYNFKGVKM